MPSPISQLVQNEQWQKIRASMVGKWKENPEWCCSQLINFISPINKCSEDKLRIVMNYLTGSAFRMGKVKHPCTKLIRVKIMIERQKRRRSQNE